MAIFTKKNEKGFSLVEVMIAIALLGIIGVAFFTSLSAASRAAYFDDELATAESLARSQMEDIKGQTYSSNGTYTQIDLTGFPSYDITWPPTVVSVGDGIQKITITVSHNNKPQVVTLEGYKAER